MEAAALSSTCFLVAWKSRASVKHASLSASGRVVTVLERGVVKART